MSTNLNVAVVGTSVISSAFIKACQESRSFNVKALFSRDKEKGLAFAETHHIETVYTSYDDLLNDQSIQVIYLASPNDLHYPQAKQALSSGKDVISEKPMVSTLAQAQTLFQLAKEKNRIIVEAITSRALPNLSVLKDHLHEIGSLKLIQIDMAQYSSRYTQLKQGQLTNVFDPAHSGGVLYDLGVYPISLILSLFGKPDQTSYIANLYSNGADTSGILTMTYPNFKAVCSFSKDSYGLHQSVFGGDEGYLQVVGPCNTLPQVFISKANVITNLSLPQNANALFYETIAFADLFKSRDQAKLEALSNHSLWLAEIMENSRKQAKIVFEADKQ